MLEYPERLKELSLQEIEKETYTTPATLVRLAKKFGYAGFVPFCKAYQKKMNAHFVIEEGDMEILKEGTVDYYTFSYYSSLVEGVNVDRSADGNLLDGGRNPFLEATDWAGRSIRWDYGFL